MVAEAPVVMPVVMSEDRAPNHRGADRLVLRLEELLDLSGGRGRGRVGAPGDCAHAPALGAHALPARLSGGR